ncbi:phosphotransferase [Exiguobacterium antarcticum]|uniref:phosphotransferase n=1 Tax=Exiguobacterium antarcticum TaxID=132920 RepID=UPI00031D4727|nr:phosphotransferase [Exiguobacterium antarcticum]
MNVSLKQRIEQQVGLIHSIHPVAEQGGTAIVYYVKTLDGTYILKQASLPRYREWLAQEATVMQTFKSQHIIIPTCIDYMEDEQQDYLLMSYIAGETLTTALTNASEFQRLALTVHSDGFSDIFMIKCLITRLPQKYGWIRN